MQIGSSVCIFGEKGRKLEISSFLYIILTLAALSNNQSFMELKWALEIIFSSPLFVVIFESLKGANSLNKYSIF